MHLTYLGLGFLICIMGVCVTIRQLTGPQEVTPITFHTAGALTEHFFPFE